MPNQDPVEHQKLKVLLVGSGFSAMDYGTRIAQALMEEGCEVSWVGTPYSMDAPMIQAQGMEFETLDFLGHPWNAQDEKNKKISKFKMVWRSIKTLPKAWSIIKRKNPDVVLALGGYVCFPVGSVAFWRGVQVMTYNAQADLMPVNRALLAISECHFESLPTTYYPSMMERWKGEVQKMKPEWVKTVGHPVQSFQRSKRSRLSEIKTESEIVVNGLKNENEAATQWSQKELSILVLAGGWSLGDHHKMIQTIAMVKKNHPQWKLHWTHQTGSHMLQEVMDEYDKEKDLTVSVGKAGQKHSGKVDVELIPFMNQPQKTIPSYDWVIGVATTDHCYTWARWGCAVVWTAMHQHSLRHDQSNAQWMNEHGAGEWIDLKAPVWQWVSVMDNVIRKNPLEVKNKMQQEYRNRMHGDVLTEDQWRDEWYSENSLVKELMRRQDQWRSCQGWGKISRKLRWFNPVFLAQRAWRWTAS